MKKKILLVTYGGGHVNIMVPIIKELLKSNVDLVVLALSIAKLVLEKEGISFRSLIDYKSEILDDDVIRYGKILADRWHVEGKGSSKEESILYFGSSMRDLVKEKGEKGANELVEKQGKKAFNPTYTMKKIIEKERPDLILTGNVPRFERAATLVGKKLDIPTINIHDYLAFEDRHKLEADKIAVMCDIARENLIARGYDPDSLVITGQPALEKIAEEIKIFNAGEIRRKIGLNPTDKTIVLGTQPNESTKHMIEATIAAVSKLDNYILLIKPHPGEDISLHKAAVVGHESKVKLIPDINIRELIFISDVMITIFSTVGFEAVLMGKPLIQLNLTGKPNPIPLHKFGVALNITSSEELLSGLKKALYDAEFKREFHFNRERHFSEIIHGKGCENIVKLVMQMLKENNG